VKILLNLTGDTTNWTAQARMLAIAIKPILETCVALNQIYLRTHNRVPPLYRSGVRYAEEPVNLARVGHGATERVEEFALIPAIIERGWDDCDGLAPWRCAELREHGEHAKIKIDWRTHPVTRRKVYHVLVRRGDGSVEDPSEKLGMRN